MTREQQEVRRAPHPMTGWAAVVPIPVPPEPESEGERPVEPQGQTVEFGGLAVEFFDLRSVLRPQRGVEAAIVLEVGPISSNIDDDDREAAIPYGGGVHGLLLPGPRGHDRRVSLHPYRPCLGVGGGAGMRLGRVTVHARLVDHAWPPRWIGPWFGVKVSPKPGRAKGRLASQMLDVHLQLHMVRPSNGIQAGLVVGLWCADEPVVRFGKNWWSHRYGRRHGWGWWA